MANIFVVPVADEDLGRAGWLEPALRRDIARELTKELRPLMRNEPGEPDVLVGVSTWTVIVQVLDEDNYRATAGAQPGDYLIKRVLTEDELRAYLEAMAQEKERMTQASDYEDPSD